MDEKLLAIILALATTIITDLVRSRIAKKNDESKQRESDGEAAESLSNAAKNLILPINEELDRLRKRLTDTESKLSDIEVRFDRLSSAYRFLVDRIKDSHPNEIKYADQIRTGEIRV